MNFAWLGHKKLRLNLIEKHVSLIHQKSRGDGKKTAESYCANAFIDQMWENVMDLKND